MKRLHLTITYLVTTLALFAALVYLVTPPAHAQPWHTVDFLVYEAERQTEHLRYIPDAADADHWLAPAELLARGGGDCEDFIHFWKSFLLERGLPETMLVYQELDNGDGTFHAVLIVDDRYVMSAGEDHHGLYEASYLDLWGE